MLFEVSGDTDPGLLEHGFRQKHGPRSSIWSPELALAKGLCLVSSGAVQPETNTGLSARTRATGQHGLREKYEPRRSRPVNGPFFSSNILSLFRARVIVG